jgi:hypothetical protein
MKNCWDSNPDNRPNIELISTTINISDRQYHEEIAEKFLFKEYKGNNQLTTHPQAIYTSRLLNCYIEGLAIDFTE